MKKIWNEQTIEGDKRYEKNIQKDKKESKTNQEEVL